MLIIFDCDGVLVDSESLAAEVFSAELQKLGIAMDACACERNFRGHTLQYCFAVLKREFPRRLPADFIEILSQATRVAFGERLKPIPGVESVLQWLNGEGTHAETWSGKGHHFCVASNGALAKIRHSLQVTGLLSYFEERCFSAESVRAGKPAPDLFLHAAQSLGFAPDDTVVVEDSSAGITAALAAGMRVCVYGAASVAEECFVNRFEHMAQLPPILKELMNC